jgi:hypothetical protein
MTLLATYSAIFGSEQSLHSIALRATAMPFHCSQASVAIWSELTLNFES